MELKKIKQIPKVGHMGLIDMRNQGATDGSLRNGCGVYKSGFRWCSLCAVRRSFLPFSLEGPEAKSHLGVCEAKRKCLPALEFEVVVLLFQEPELNLCLLLPVPLIFLLVDVN